jgi:hypothetical protein
MEKFEEKAFLTSVMFSVKTPRAIVEILKSKLEEFDVGVQLHSNKWKLTYVRKSELDDQQRLKGVEPEVCKVQVKILALTEDGDKKAIEFTRVSGSARFFYEQFSALKEQLSF